MKQKTLSNYLKGIILSMAIIGLIIYFKIFPSILTEVLTEFNLLKQYNIWSIIFLISSIPCFLVLVCGWFIATNIGIDQSFSKENANYLKIITILTLIDTIYFFIANVVLYIYHYSSPIIFTISLIIAFSGIAIAIISACLSHLVMNAYELKIQSDLTI